MKGQRLFTAPQLRACVMAVSGRGEVCTPDVGENGMITLPEGWCRGKDDTDDTTNDAGEWPYSRAESFTLCVECVSHEDPRAIYMQAHGSLRVLHSANQYTERVRYGPLTVWTDPCTVDMWMVSPDGAIECFTIAVYTPDNGRTFWLVGLYAWRGTVYATEWAYEPRHLDNPVVQGPWFSPEVQDMMCRYVFLPSHFCDDFEHHWGILRDPAFRGIIRSQKWKDWEEVPRIFLDKNGRREIHPEFELRHTDEPGCGTVIAFQPFVGSGLGWGLVRLAQPLILGIGTDDMQACSYAFVDGREVRSRTSVQQIPLLKVGDVVHYADVYTRTGRQLCLRDVVTLNPREYGWVHPTYWEGE